MEELTTIIQETTNAQEHLQQVFKEGIIDGLYKGFMIILPYLLAVIAFVLIMDIIKKILKKK